MLSYLIAVKRCALVHAYNEVIVMSLSPAAVIQPRYRNIYTFCGHTIKNDIYFLMVRIQIYQPNSAVRHPVGNGLPKTPRLSVGSSAH